MRSRETVWLGDRTRYSSRPNSRSDSVSVRPSPQHSARERPSSVNCRPGSLPSAVSAGDRLRRSSARTRASSSSNANGLARKSVAPASSAATFASTERRADSTSTGTWLAAWDSSRRTSKPLLAGSSRSRIARFHSSSRSRRQATSPSGATPGGVTNVTFQTVASYGHQPHPDWVSYLVKNQQGQWVHSTVVQVPAHSLIRFTVYNYDGASGLRNPLWSLPRGTVGGTETIDG